jgi:hypothetical protein
MADRKFTLLELHFDGDVAFSASATNEAPAIGRGPADDDETSADDDAGTACGCSRGRLVLGAVILAAVLAVLVRKLRGGDADLDDLEELDEG